MKNKVLFVDDEIKVLNSIKRSTLDEEYESYIATSGEKALELLSLNEFSVMVTDMRMPGMDGLALLKKVKELYPDVVRMVLSGYNQLPQILTTINQVGVSKFILKPWLVEEEFLPAVREGVAYFNIKKEGEELKKALVNRNSAYQNILKSNNEVMGNIQKDLNNVRQVYESIQSINKALLSKIKAGSDLNIQFNAFINLSTNIFNGFLGCQPTKNEEFALNKLLKELKSELDEKIISDVEESELNFRGNYKLILYVVIEMCRYLNEDITDNKIFIELNKTSKEKLAFTVDKKMNPNINFEKNDMSFLIYLLNSISTLFGGRVTLEKEVIQISFIFNV